MTKEEFNIGRDKLINRFDKISFCNYSEAEEEIIDEFEIMFNEHQKKFHLNQYALNELYGIKTDFEKVKGLKSKTECWEKVIRDLKCYQKPKVHNFR